MSCSKCGQPAHGNTDLCPRCTTSYKVDSTKALVLSLLSTFLCCMPLGIVGLVYTLTANNAENLETAQKKIKFAEKISIWGMVGGVVFVLLYFGFIFFVGFGSMMY